MKFETFYRVHKKHSLKLFAHDFESPKLWNFRLRLRLRLPHPKGPQIIIHDVSSPFVDRELETKGKSPMCAVEATFELDQGGMKSPELCII